MNRYEKVEAREAAVEANPPSVGVAVAVQELNHNCDAERFNRAVDRAEHFERLGATGIEVYYDSHWDFMMVLFTFEGHHYAIRTYKVHSVSVDRADDFVLERSFPSEFKLFEFFEGLL